ncbi:hypothetical protein [Spirosoma koreense]
MNIILIGSIITIGGALLGGFVTAMGTYLQNKSSSARNERIETGVNKGLEIGEATGSGVKELKVQNVELLDKVEQQKITIDSLRKENTELYSKLNEASNTIFNHVKGGLEPSYFSVSYSDILSLRVDIVNENMYSVYGVRIDVIDYDSIRQCKGGFSENKIYIVDESCLKKHLKSTQVPEVNVGLTVMDHSYLGMKKIESSDYGRYQIAIKSRYNFFIQQLVYKKVKNTTYSTSRILAVKNKPNMKITDLRDVSIVKIIESGSKELQVDFDKEFPTGIIDFSVKM